MKAIKKRRQVKYLLGCLLVLCTIIAIIEKLGIPLPLSASPKAGDGMYTIVIDAGHGGTDPGAESIRSNYEKEFTLSLSERIYDLLQDDPMFEPIMTRADDTFIELEDRAAVANQSKADALISIHGNTFTDSSVTGTETYYYSDDSRQLAEVLHQHIAGATQLADRGVKREQWRVLTRSKVPAILAEIGYLTNTQDEKAMRSAKFQKKVAQSIVDGLRAYFQMGSIS